MLWGLRSLARYSSGLLVYLVLQWDVGYPGHDQGPTWGDSLGSRARGPYG